MRTTHSGWWWPQILAASVIVWASVGVNAQMVTFNWTSVIPSDEINLLSIPECSSFSIILTPSENGTYEPVPPFYMISFAIAGPVEVDRLHGDEVNGGTLVWDAIPHTQGSTVAMYVVDSIGNSGDGDVISIINGTTSNCHPSVPFAALNMTVDKQQVSTCDIVNVMISGGKKPYTVSIVGQQDPPIQNITMGPEDDTLEVVNRSPPGGGMSFAASDADGQWSFASTLIPSIGSSDLSCNGRQSRSFQSNGDSRNQSRSKSNAAAIAGGVVGGIILLTILAVGICYWQRRRQRMAKVKHGGAVDLGKDEVVPLSEGEALPYIVTRWEGPDNLSGAGRGDQTNRHSPNYNPDSKRPQRPSPVEAPLLESRQRPPSPAISLNANAAPPAVTAIQPVVSMTQTNVDARGNSQFDAPQTRPIVRHVDAEEAYELPPEYRDWMGPRRT